MLVLCVNLYAILIYICNLACSYQENTVQEALKLSKNGLKEKLETETPASNYSDLFSFNLISLTYGTTIPDPKKILGDDKSNCDCTSNSIRNFKIDDVDINKNKRTKYGKNIKPNFISKQFKQRSKDLSVNEESKGPNDDNPQRSE